LVVPSTGDLVGTWGSTAINPDFSAIDGFFGGIQTIGVSNTNVVLTAPAGSITPSGGPTQSQNAVLRFTGTLTGAVQVTLPLPGHMIIENLMTGNFVLSFRDFGSGQIIWMLQGGLRHIYNDGTNVRFVNLPDPGSLWDLVTSSVPSWIAACTVPPWLNCNGATFNGTTYPYLASLLGGTTLPDLRGVTRYTLNQGTSRITSACSGLDGNTLLSIKTSQTYTIQTANLPPYTPTGNINLAQSGTIPIQGESGTTPTATSAHFGATDTLVSQLNLSANPLYAFSGNGQGGTSAPFGVVATGTVAGITLIRAA